MVALQDEEDFVDRAVLFDDSLDLAQLVHQADLGVESTSRVD